MWVRFPQGVPENHKALSCFVVFLLRESNPRGSERKKQSSGLFLAKNGEGVSQTDSMRGIAEADGRFPQGVPKQNHLLV